MWYREFGGAVLSTAIDKCCYITCRRLPPFFEYHSRVSYSRVENVNQNSAIEHPSVRACLKYMGVDEGVEIHHVADLPARTGLGTSSAFTVGLLLGLYALRDQMRNKHALAADAIQVEQEVIEGGGRLTGSDYRRVWGLQSHQFQYGRQFRSEASNGFAGQIGCASADTLRSILPDLPEPLRKLRKEQIKMTPHRKHELDTMYQMVDEAEAIVTNPNRSLDEFGHLLHESWQVKRTLTQNITNSNLDEIYEAGRSAGALGGKLLGAGGGGFMLFFVPPERRKELRCG